MEVKMIKEHHLIMADQTIKIAFGKRLKELRKQKRWTQKELAAMVNIGFSQFNKYECGLHIPPAEKLIELSRLLDTSVDYLLSGDDLQECSLHNTRLIKRFQELERFDADDQEAIIKVLDAMIMKNKMQGALSPLDSHPK
jgi:transcriptional regulator with XRE-family HTH domain